MIAFRNNNEAFRLASRDEINNRLEVITAKGGNIEYNVDSYKVIHSVTGTSVELDGTYQIVYSNVRSSYGTVSGSVSVATNESVVLKKVS